MLKVSQKRAYYYSPHITLATCFTVARIILTPFIVAAMAQQSWPKAFYLFVAAALTDVIDGIVARCFNARTYLGACLDALADKFLLLSCFATFTFIKSPQFIIPGWFFALIFFKELILVSGSLFLYVKKGSLEIKPSFLGKAATFIQICFIIWVFSCYFFEWWPLKTYRVFLMFVIGMTIASLLHYMARGIIFFINKKENLP